MLLNALYKSDTRVLYTEGSLGWTRVWLGVSGPLKAESPWIMALSRGSTEIFSQPQESRLRRAEDNSSLC